MLVLVACNNQGAVVFEPTPLPPAERIVHYVDPTAAIQLDVPELWAVYQQNNPTQTASFFTPPGLNAPLLEVAAIRLDGESSSQPISELVASYQNMVRPDRARYSEQDRQQLPDGSWRITGLRTTIGGLSEQVNTFIIKYGDLIAIINATLPPDSGLQTRLEQIINTLQLNPDTALEPAPLITLSSASGSPLVVTSTTSWSTTAGIYFVTGEVANTGADPVTSVPVDVRLLDGQGNTTAEAFDRTMGPGIAPGQFAPFSLRFGQGLPPETTDFLLTLGDDAWRADGNSVALAGSESLSWNSTSSFTPEGHLLISGTVNNTGSQSVHNLVAIATVFGSQQKVIAAGFSEIDVTSLAPGEAADYTIRIQEMGGTPENFIVDIQGYFGE